MYSLLLYAYNYIPRLCWIVAMLCCTVFCGIEMAKVWNRWNVSPVIITFASRPTRVEDLPFPAITICPKLQISRDDFDLFSALIKISSNESEHADVFKLKENLRLLNTTHEISNVKPVVNAHPLKGAITGLKIRLRMPEYLYQNLCRNAEPSENFKVFVHSPYEYPSMQGGHEFIEVLGWSKTEVRLRAAISTTDPKLKVYSTNVRHCRFPDDQQLKNFKVIDIS
ncbi:hypothetical protein B566_EDAN002446 [Ephemera danica]|nr:hypothetical protein B566_EDAN002446 [Ephemera danica]